MNAPATKTAWTLSLAGVIPFAAGTLALYFLDQQQMRSYAALILATYGAVILSFLGGVRWGAVLHGDRPQATTFVIAMAPPLVGWFALAVPLPFPFLIHAAAFALVAVWDWWSGTLPEWFLRLRITISAIVCALLILAFTATLTGAP